MQFEIVTKTVGEKTAKAELRVEGGILTLFINDYGVLQINQNGLGRLVHYVDSTSSGGLQVDASGRLKLVANF